MPYNMSKALQGGYADQFRDMIPDNPLLADYAQQAMQQGLSYVDEIPASIVPHDRDAMQRAKLLEMGIDVNDPNAPRLTAYEPTWRMQEKAAMQDALMGFGMEPYRAGKLSGNFTGDADGVGLADFTPLGMLYGIQEGDRTYQRGVNTDDPWAKAAGVGEMALNAIPGGFGAKAFMKTPMARNAMQTASERYAAGKTPIHVGMSVEDVSSDVPYNASGYQSRLNPAIEAMKQEKMTAAQAQGHFKNFPGGVGSDELDYTGVQGLLDQGGPVTRTGLLEQANMQPLEITDVVKGIDEGQVARLTAEENKWADIAEDIQDKMLVFEESDLPIPEGMRDRWLEASQKSQQAGEDLIDVHMIADNEDYAPKFSEYQLPGGEDYREMLLTLPSNRPSLKTMGRDEYNEAVRVADSSGVSDYTSGHYDEPNVLAHARYNTRNIDGDKTMFVEEIQSDWHQTGRDKGYGTEPMTGDVVKQEPQPGMPNAWKIDWEDGTFSGGYDTQEHAAAAMAYRGRMRTGVPDAPYKKNWHDLTLRRMLKQAADEGHDRIAWTPGRTQVDRYEETLRQNVDSVHYEPDGDGGFNVGAMKDGRQAYDGEGLSIDEVEEVLGKDIAKKIRDDAGVDLGESPLRPDLRTLQGDDLSIGGDGMKNFYDSKLVNSANKFGKKYGAKVEVKPMWTAEAYDAKSIDDFVQGGGDIRAAEAEGIRTGEAKEVWSMKLTPEMKKALAGGVALSGMGVLGADQTGATSMNNALLGIK